MSGVELSPLTHLGEVGRAAGRSGGGDGAALAVEPLASLRRQAVERIRIGGQHEWAIECGYVVLGVGHVDGIGNGLLDGRGQWCKNKTIDRVKDNTDHLVLLGLRIGDHLVQFAQLQRGGVPRIVDADGETRVFSHVVRQGTV